MSPNTKILIVEDECVLAENLQNYLYRTCSNIRIAEDADVADEILHTFSPDLVLLDYGLPGMNGLQTYTKVIRSFAPQARCILISGQLSEDIANKAHDYGIDNVLRKPFSFLELQNKIDQSLGGQAEIFSKIKYGSSDESNRRRTNRRLTPSRRKSDMGIYQDRRTNPF